MKKLSLPLLAQTVLSRRKSLKITQVELSKATGINRGLLSRLESEDYSPSVDQLQALSEVLGFQVTDILLDPDAASIHIEKTYRIALRPMTCASPERPGLAVCRIRCLSFIKTISLTS